MNPSTISLKHKNSEVKIGDVHDAGGGPGLAVIGGDSCSKGCGFESQCRILDGHFSHLFVVEIVMFV